MKYPEVAIKNSNERYKVSIENHNEISMKSPLRLLDTLMKSLS